MLGRVLNTPLLDDIWLSFSASTVWVCAVQKQPPEKFAKNFKNTYFEEHLGTTASSCDKDIVNIVS